MPSSSSILTFAIGRVLEAPPAENQVIRKSKFDSEELCTFARLNLFVVFPGNCCFVAHVHKTSDSNLAFELVWFSNFANLQKLCCYLLNMMAFLTFLGLVKLKNTSQEVLNV